MHFELNPWELRDRGEQIFSSPGAIFSFNFFDPFIERLALKVIWKNSIPKNNLINSFGNDVNIEWLENNIFNVGFFAGNDSYAIYESDRMEEHVVDFFFANVIHHSNTSVFFSSTKGKNYFKELGKKSKEINSVVIKRPSPWTWDRYLNFLANEMGVKMTTSAKEYVADAVPKTSGDLIPLLKYLRELQRVENIQVISKEDIEKCSHGLVVDKFRLVHLLGDKNFSGFYYQLLRVKDDSSALRELLTFSQSYLIKMSDPSYMNSKKSVSKFDEDILYFSKNWEEQELNRTLSEISSLEVMNKSNQTRVGEEIRLKYLQAVNL